MNSNRPKIRSGAICAVLLAAPFLASHAQGQTPGDYTNIGVYRAAPDGGVSLWIVDSNGNHAYDSTDQVFSFGLADDIPIMGDWTGTHHLQMGTYRCDTTSNYGYWYIDWNDNHYWDAGDTTFSFGLCRRHSRGGRLDSYRKIADWRRPHPIPDPNKRKTNLYYWYVNTSPECGSSNPQGCDYSYTVNTYGLQYIQVFQFGLPGDTPVTGNWQSPGVLGVGIYRPSEEKLVPEHQHQYLCRFARQLRSSLQRLLPYTNYPSNDTTIPFYPVGINTGTAVTGCWLGACPQVSAGFFNGGPWYTGATGSQQTGNFGVSGDVPLAGPWLCPAPTGSGLSITTNTTLYGETGVYYSKVLQATGSNSTVNTCLYTWTASS